MTMHRSGAQERRVSILFHESAVLGAGVSVLRAVEFLRPYGWSAAGWFPAAGPLVGESEGILESVRHAQRPIAVSLRGWRRAPGAVQRLRGTPVYLRAVRRWLELERPDVVHVNSLLMLPEASVARRLGLPIVLQVHEIPPAGRKRDLTLAWARATADVMVGVSDAVSAMLLDRRGRMPVITVQNGVPIVESSLAARDGFTVGTVGHVSRTKGTDVFLHAAAITLREDPDVRFEHIGPARPWGDVEFEDRVSALANAAPLRDSLSMLGERPVRDAYQRWSVFVLPSRQEGFPLSTLEAMAAGVPVVAAEVGGVPEQIAHLENGVLVPPDDPPAIASWIERLHEDRDLRARIAAAGRTRVRSEFTLERQAEGLNRAYETALRRRG
jgi:glycosyltransferase involved in cell wall biosynthesis